MINGPAPETPDAPVQIGAYPDGIIDQVLSHRVCARCYGDLVKQPAEGRQWTAGCPKCGDAWQGATVSRNYAVALGQRALAEYIEVKWNPALQDVFPRRKASEQQILAELGIGD